MTSFRAFRRLLLPFLILLGRIYRDPTYIQSTLLPSSKSHALPSLFYLYVQVAGVQSEVGWSNADLQRSLKYALDLARENPAAERDNLKGKYGRNVFKPLELPGKRTHMESVANDVACFRDCRIDTWL